MHGPILARDRDRTDAGGVRAFQLGLALHRRVYGEHLSIQRHAEDVGAELLADPDLAIQELDAFGVEVGAGQVAGGVAFIGNAEGGS